MKSSIVTLLAVVLVAGLYVYIHSTTPIEDEPVATGTTNAAVAPATSNVAENPTANVKKPAFIGSLRSRQHTIYLYVGKFTVEDANGKVLAWLVNEKQFSTLLPELFGEFKQMYAEGQIIADNLTYGKPSDGWVYSTPTRVEAVSDP